MSPTIITRVSATTQSVRLAFSSCAGPRNTWSCTCLMLVLLMSRYSLSSLGVAANGFKQFFNTLVAFIFTEGRVRDMLASVILDDFFHQAIDSPASGSDKMQCFRAVEIRFQCTLNGLDLSGDAFNTLEKIVFVGSNMAHGIPPYLCVGSIGIPPIHIQAVCGWSSAWVNGSLAQSDLFRLPSVVRRHSTGSSRSTPVSRTIPRHPANTFRRWRCQQRRCRSRLHRRCRRAAPAMPSSTSTSCRPGPRPCRAAARAVQGHSRISTRPQRESPGVRQRSAVTRMCCKSFDEPAWAKKSEPVKARQREVKGQLANSLPLNRLIRVFTISMVNATVRNSRITAAMTISTVLSWACAYFSAALLRAAMGKLMAHHEGAKGTSRRNTLKPSTTNRN